MSKENRRSALWITMMQAGLLGVVAGLSGYLLLTTILEAPARAQSPGAAGFQGPPPFGPGGGFPGFEERKVVAQFDKNGDGRLDNAERKAARESLAAEPAGRGFGRRGGGGFGRGGMTPGSPGPKVTPADVKNYPNAPLYDPGTLRTVFLQFENADWEKELAAFYHTDVEVPATLTVDGKTYKDVGVHFRGTSSYMMVPAGSKRSLEPVVRFRRRGRSGSAATARSTCSTRTAIPTFLRAVALLRDRARSTSRRRRRTTCASSSTARAGASTSTRSSSTRTSCASTSRATKGARWKVPGSPGGTRRPGVPRRRRRPPTSGCTRSRRKDDPKAWADSHQAVPGAERDAGREARSGARADPRRRRRA